MTPEKKRTPGGNRANEGHSRQLQDHYSALERAAATALARELNIILLAADRMAAGYGLAWPDYSRLHQAHQHVLTVLATVTGREVIQ